jgi:hypothetical protein
MRAGDDDREAVAERLRSAYAEGRLDQVELDERLGRAYSAKTLADLVPLTSDLPVSKVPARSGARAPARRDWTRTGLRAAWAAWATAVSVNVVIWLIVVITSGNWVYPWPLWVAGPWGAVLVAATIFGSPPKRPPGPQPGRGSR